MFVTEGSPPQVRGKHTDVVAREVDFGITPAGAGKTLSICIGDSLLRDHPRRCGENFFACRNDGFARGSPPQVRGKRWRNVDKTRISGITPAGAGKTGD